ncbi:MAG: phosphoribosylglycinamide formyltransferase [Spirochaetales bacterium]
MARVGILASGGGSNFQAIAEHLASHPGPGGVHEVAVLLCDKPGAYCLDRAAKLGVPAHTVAYTKGEREAAERQLTAHLEAAGTDLVVLAGFMRILTPLFVRRWQGKLINIHPALLPRHPGAHGLEDSYDSGDPELGITVHYVDEGVDTGPVIEQRSFPRHAKMSLEEAEFRIHELEHELYPVVVRRLLDSLA